MPAEHATASNAMVTVEWDFDKWDWSDPVACIWSCDDWYNEVGSECVVDDQGQDEPSEGGGMSGRWWIWKNNILDDEHWSAEENSDWNEIIGDIGDINGDVDDLYQWAYENEVTTVNILEDSDPDGLVTRWHLAKMVVNYMVNVLWKRVPYDVTYNCLYWGDDESVWESDEIKEYATKACAFWIMWINMKNNEFLPNAIVTRAEFWTVMSRVLWGDRYDIMDTDNRVYYEDHLQALKRDGILMQIENPEARWEIRKWVWLVFRRISEIIKK